jgi:hypothetical protein
MPRQRSEVTKVVGKRAAELLRSLADVVERGEFHDLQIDSIGQYHSLLGEPIRKQYSIRIVTEESSG